MHLQHQIATLSTHDTAAANAIREIVCDEQQHHDQSALHLEASNFWRRLLTPMVSAATEAVIWLGMRL